MIYTMMQACKEADMTYQALKYYCNEGLVPNVKRDKNNRRIFDEKDITITRRKEMLSVKREELLSSIQELESCVDYIDWKQQFYDDVLSGKRPYVSNLIASK